MIDLHRDTDADADADADADVDADAERQLHAEQRCYTGAAGVRRLGGQARSIAASAPSSNGT